MAFGTRLLGVALAVAVPLDCAEADTVVADERCFAALDQIFFKHNSAVVRADQNKVLRPIAALLARCPTERPVLVLHGGADRSEQDESLPRRRAQAVRARLVKMGITVERLRVDPAPAEPAQMACRTSSCRSVNQRVWLELPEPR